MQHAQHRANNPMDKLTKFEQRIHYFICYGALILVFLCIYISVSLVSENDKFKSNIVGFTFFAAYGIFGLAIRKGVRVLDLRRFEKNSSRDSTMRVDSQTSLSGTTFNLAVTGSDITARDVLLSAKQDVILQAATDTDSSRNDSRSSGFNVGVTLGANTGVPASSYTSKGYGNNDGTTQRNTHIPEGTQSIALARHHQ